MIVDGKAMAAELLAVIKNEVSHLPAAPHLTVVTSAPSFATQKYVALKKRRAEEVGIEVNLIELPASVTTEEVCTVLDRIAMQTDGVIVQLPLPSAVDVDTVLSHIPSSIDVDGMHYAVTGSGHLPPVVAAVAELSRRYDVLFAGQQVVVIGHGRLVGQPAAVWAANQGAQVTVLTEATPDYYERLAIADIIISGAGVPHIIKLEHIKDGAVCFDAGTSEMSGMLQGDIDPTCNEKASLLTPVPGGIGPMTVALLLMNVLLAAKGRAQ